MWLLNTRTYELQNFISGSSPPYAILSHRWGRNEVSFADMQDLSVAQRRRGWEKVEKACWCALNTFNCYWIWDDTCCIDKSSSAELSEAINSMYAWYRASTICIAYLHDVMDLDDDFPERALASFRDSRWFTRGWTLQELIAPLKLVFFSTSWRELGTRMDWATVLEDITGIDANVLNRHGTDPEEPLSRKSVAERMSWASRRETTREEDLAYCLMGVFNVHMPPIYGEGGEGAFRRLQLEIIQHTNDRSILAWGHDVEDCCPIRSLPPGQTYRLGTGDSHVWSPSRVFAPSPAYFSPKANMRMKILNRDIAKLLNVEPIGELHYTHTNAGIRIRLPLRRSSLVYNLWGPSAVYCAALGCCTMPAGERGSEGDQLGIVALLLVQAWGEPDGSYICVEGGDRAEFRSGYFGTQGYRPARARLATASIPVLGQDPLRGWEVSTIYILTDVEDRGSYI